MVITIDGPAGAGKSTVARAVAERLSLRHVDTGAMYRELTAIALAEGADVDDGPALAALVGRPAPPGTDLRSARISASVSAVSRHEEVRERMRARQRELAADAVLEGRDTGTRVCPGADVKVYLTASVAERSRRRAGELGLPQDEVARAIEERDRLDAVQLAPAADAHTIDTTELSSDEVVDRVAALATSTDPHDGAWKVLRATIGWLVHVVVRPRVRGLEHVARCGPLVIVANHESWWDIPALGWVQPRTIRYMAKSELFRHPLLGTVVRWGGAFPVRRGEPDRSALRSVHDVLERGGVVGVFIQGHRQAELDGAKAGVGRIAVVEDVAVVPAAIRGTRRWRPGRRVTITFGPPRRYARDGRRMGDAARETAEALMGEIREMHGRSQ
jgi:cytidylate kinase